MAVILFILSGLFFLLAQHPFVTYPLSLRVLRRWRRQPILPAGETAENIALLVCAYNEEAIIAEKAENMLALKRVFPQLEMFIYVDGAIDRTAEILERYKKRIHVLATPRRRGKTYGMNQLVSLTKASILIFTDANVMFDVESFRHLIPYFADGLVGCVCGHLQYTNTKETVTAANGSLYWRLEERIKQLESDTGSVMGADGSVFAIRRELHRPPPASIVDDMFVSLNILCDGYRIVRAPDVLAYEASVTSPHEEFARKARIACMAYNAHRLLWPRLRRLSALNLYKYISHKWLRWLTIYWLALSAMFFEGGMIYSDMGTEGAAIMVLGSIALATGKILRIPPAPQLADILMAFLGAGLGVFRSIRGERLPIWAPAASIRNSIRIAQG